MTPPSRGRVLRAAAQTAGARPRYDASAVARSRRGAVYAERAPHRNAVGTVEVEEPSSSVAPTTRSPSEKCCDAVVLVTGTSVANSSRLTESFLVSGDTGGIPTRRRHRLEARGYAGCMRLRRNQGFPRATDSRAGRRATR
jgi:hypothetical protein